MPVEIASSAVQDGASPADLTLSSATARRRQLLARQPVCLLSLKPRRRLRRPAGLNEAPAFRSRAASSGHPKPPTASPWTPPSSVPRREALGIELAERFRDRRPGRPRRSHAPRSARAAQFRAQLTNRSGRTPAADPVVIRVAVRKEYVGPSLCWLSWKGERSAGWNGRLLRRALFKDSHRQLIGGSSPWRVVVERIQAERLANGGK